MRRVRCAALAAVVVFGFASVASAADLPVKAPLYKAPVAVAPSWTGFYSGGHFGGGWGNRDVDYTANDPASADLFNGGTPSPTSFKSSGALGGLQLGYNWQLNRNWLIGLETDFTWSGMKGSGSTSLNIIGTPITVPVDEHVKWFGTVRARLGYLPNDNLLAYVTGGFAYGKVERTGAYNDTSSTAGFAVTVGNVDVLCNTNSSCFSGSSSRTATGWAGGGGLEYEFMPKWTLKAEYLYVSLASKSVTETAPLDPGFTPATINANFSRTSFNVARLGINYRF